ncbi:MAG: molybdopterin-dependent oxidoreductase [Gaiellales bacterium]
MSATEPAVETVTLTIDGRELTVPKGTPLVVAAAEGVGVEIPVFCYEPRLGPPIGACRMCLVEVEGAPKLQAACTMTCADGMVVRTAEASEQAKEAQDAVLEFILLNHPLDCPVCDKGGECPLQDLTFRYGPGSSRMTLPKRTYEKPLPISPSIVLDRERCILCYRCTRFSGDVAEDGELVARERGAQSVIATFDEKPYANAFSGNVTELCPVGALLPTAYRFKARPWEIVNVPTVCTGCATGCNTWSTLREGKVERILSRNHPDVDGGWLCDKGRFARYEPRDERIAQPLERGQAGLEPAAWDDALRTVAQRLRHHAAADGPGAVAILTGGALTNEEALAWSRIAQDLGARTASAPLAAPAELELVDPYAATLADLERADLVLVVGDQEPADRAGTIDLRIRQARRDGAHLAIVGPGGTSLEADARTSLRTLPGAGSAALAALVAAALEADGERVRGDAGAAGGVEELAGLAGAEVAPLRSLAAALADAERPVLVVTDPVAATELAHAGWALGLDRTDGGILPLPVGPNERGERAVGLVGGWDEVLPALEAGEISAIALVGCDPVVEGVDGERWQMALAQAPVVVAVAAFTNGVTAQAQVVLPLDAEHERDGSVMNLEGRVQRVRPSLAPVAGVPLVEWTSRLAGFLDVATAPSAAKAFALLAEGNPAFAGLAWGELGDRAPLHRARPTAQAVPAMAPQAPPAAPPDGAFRLIAPRPLFSGAAVERTPTLAHQRAPWVGLAHADAERLGIKRGDEVSVRHAAGEHTGLVRISRRQLPGSVRINWRGAPAGPSATVEAR